MMVTNNSSTILIGGLTALGMALIVAGVGMYRRWNRGAASEPQSDTQAEADAKDEERIQGGKLPDRRGSNKNDPSKAAQRKLPWNYFALVFALTIPFWLFGGRPLPIPVKLPTSALALVIPMIAALFLTYRRKGWTGIKELFKKVVDYRKIQNKAWYLPAIFLYPAIAVLSYAVMRLAERPLPEPQIPWLMAPVILAGFFIAGIGEELGWMGYAFDPMQERWGAVKASVALGVIWGLYHFIPDLQNDRTLDWILWQRLGGVAFRVLIAWVYNNTGRSVFTAILFHATNNLAWAMFPNNGSHYDPMLTGIFSLVAAGIVLVGWEPRTLRRYRLDRVAPDR